METLLPTILVVLAGFITWFLKENSEKLKLQRERLVEEKRKNYDRILEPIIRVFTGMKNPNELKKAIKDIQSFDYRKTAFQLMQFGSDEVVNAYNDYFQYLYNNESELEPYLMLDKLGSLVLEIRKDIGNSKTQLKSIDMLRFMITDINKLKKPK